MNHRVHTHFTMSQLKKTTKIKVKMYYIISIQKVNIDLTMSPFGPAGPAGPGGPSVPCKE